MRIIVFAFIFLLCVPAAFARAEAVQTHICPMHPHIHGQEGDNCPVCGMFLVPKETEEDTNSPPEEEGSIKIEPRYRQALGVKTDTAALHEFGRRIEAYGHIEARTRDQHVFAVRTSGWIAELEKDAVGDRVEKGEKLFSFYSPDLMSAQADYLVGRRSGRPVGDTEGRLRLYGMDDKAIKILQKNVKAMEKTPFHAPAGGVVSALPLRQGSFARAGETVLVLQDYRRLWVVAHLPLRDLQRLHEDASATVMIDETGDVFPAVIETVLPESDPVSRTGMVRLLLDNPDGRLKTDMLVHVVFEAERRERLAVPAQAVLYGKDSAYVMEESGDGYFRPVHVKTGITANGMTEILSGLEDGRKIVVTGQFMIDAESTLQAGLSAMDGADAAESGYDHKH